jgi:hypothetical protein
MQISHYEHGPADHREKFLIIRINQGIEEIKRIFRSQSGTIYTGLRDIGFWPDMDGITRIIIPLDRAESTSQTGQLLYDLAYSESHGRIADPE